MTQLEKHKKIDEFFKAGMEVATIEIAQELISDNDNYDAKNYFFSKADETWLVWFGENGLFDDLEKPAVDKTKLVYQMPELGYLQKCVEKDPEGVTEIIDSIKISDLNFNPEVVDRFLWIVNSMPAEQIKKVTKKIRDEKWAQLMLNFRKSGYEFEKMVKKLAEEKEGEAIIELAQAILLVCNKEDLKSENMRFDMDNPFYVSDINASGIFEALAGVDKQHIKRALEIATSILSKIIELGEVDKSEIFDYVDPFPLFDVDFFNFDLEDRQTRSFRDDVKNFVAVIKNLIERSIGQDCDEAVAKNIFDYIEKLPKCRSVWRLRLFTMAQCPDVFKEKLNKAFFRLFKVDNYYEIAGGTEYKKALKIAFPSLSYPDHRDYVAEVLKYFIDKEKENPDQGWHKRRGWEILSSISKYLKNNEPEDCEKIFGKKCDEKYEPEPSIGKMRGGTVHHISPFDLGKFAVAEIITNLKTEWTPKKLKEQFKDEDSLNPKGAEGLGDALEEDIKKRTDDYLNNFENFFEQGFIHSHYLYSLLRGIEEMYRGGQKLELPQIDKLFELFKQIKTNEKNISVKKDDSRSWLAGITAVHTAVSDVLRYIIQNEERKAEVHKKHRADIYKLISYLFESNNPSKDDEKPEYGDLHTIAINSVRGRTFEVFVVFVENDGKILADDTKELYKKILDDESLAVRFLVGRYFASFYFRGVDFVSGLLPKIFPKDNVDKKEIYLATWEGYLSNMLYDKIFVALKEYYSHAIDLEPKDYIKRKSFKDMDELLAVHIALAFAHLGLEFDDELFEQFWRKANSKRHQEFISFTGRVSLAKKEVDRERLKKFWEWALENVSDKKALSSFGSWVGRGEGYLDDNFVAEKMADTLKLSDGDIDNDYDLLHRLSVLAEKNKEKTFEIIYHYLLNSKDELNQNRRVPFLYQDEIKKALDIIYKGNDEDMKEKMVDLINILIEKGSSMFWGLKEILE